MDELIETGKSKFYSRWLLIVAWLAMLIFAGHSSTHMVGAGDTWVAMACGRHFYNHGVDTIEPFSANSHKAGPTEEEIKTWPKAARWIADKVGLDTVRYWHPTGWINQNWLTHLIFYWVTHESPIADADTFSFNSLVYGKFAIYIITVICIFYTGRILGAHVGLSAFFACAAMFIGRSFYDIRPAGFSNMLTAVFLLILVLTTYRNILYIWLIVPITAFWCNVHGGYIYVFIMLVPFVGLNLLTSFFPKRFVSIGKKGLYHTVAAGAVTLLATIVFNPFHLTNLTHTFVISFSKHAEKWREVNEWHPAFEWSNPVGTGFPFLVMLVLGIGLSICWLYSRVLKPRFFKAPKNELIAQEKAFSLLSKIFGWAAAILVCWVVFLSFSFLGLALGSFFVCSFFMAIILLCVYKNVHFIYLAGLLTLLALWSAGDKEAYMGRYIYPFLMVPAYVVTAITASVFSKNINKKPLNIVFVVSTAVVTLLLMTAIFDPFGTGKSVWNLKQFVEIQRPWRPFYEGRSKFDYSHLFIVLYLLNAVLIAVWLSLGYLKRFFAQPEQKADIETTADTETYQLPKLDLAMIAIAVLTVYMAYRSRRFITLAAIAACPVMAMFVQQMFESLSAARNFYKKNRFVVSALPGRIELFFIIAGSIVVLSLGTWWTVRFNHVYLKPWPTDTVLNSVFMRMTASNMKPFWACKFIRDNHIDGKMFNYWTEGGFVAYGQEPNTVTGETPLQLFMDGRAQAAYDRRAFDIWSMIMFGGPMVEQVRRSRRTLTREDYVTVGKWLDERLKERDVWITLMPSAQFRSDFVRGIESSPYWTCVFMNNKQKIYVNISTSKGKALLEGIFSGETVYPDKFTRNLAYAYNVYKYYAEKPARSKALDAAIEAFEISPSAASMEQVLAGVRYEGLAPRIVKVCVDFLAEWQQKREQWTREHGYHHKISSAIVAADYLGEVAKAQKRMNDHDSYKAKRDELVAERSSLVNGKRW